jgi:hypothetical protein
MWKLLDCVSSAAPGRANEDAWGVCGSLAWVIDGATPLADTRRSGSPSVVQEFAMGVSRVLERLAPGVNESADLAFLLERGLADQPLPSDTPRPPNAAIGLVLEDGSRLSYALLADVFVVVGRDASCVIRDQRMAPVNREANEAVEAGLADGLSLEDAFERIQPLLIAQRTSRMNMGREDAYWTLTPDPKTARHAVRGVVPRTEGTPVLICSDGFARLVVDAGAYSWADLMDAAFSRGLEALLNELRELESKEPAHRNGFVRISRYDDATALLLE